MHVSGSTVLITGATGGLGRTLARAFASRGADLLLTGRRAEPLRKLADSVGGRAIVADLNDREDLARLAEEAAGVDILIANAAQSSSGPVLESPLADIDRSLEVNLRAPIALARMLGPGMVEARRGHIVLVGSLSGRTASPGAALYNATKFGLRGFAHALRQELHGSGVGVSIVQPGFVRDVGMFADSGATLPPGVRTVSPGQVAAATIRAVERDRGEVTIAPLELRLSGVIGGLFPGVAGAVQRRVGARTMREMAEARRSGDGDGSTAD
ncbi:SDR family oxidoreductase [Streptomyces sp. SAJ15]|uniref:SDR family NAD(P)-dependent oxidoreductase n=1 Tax=Streptomyces sp. SAJ15 TaxID=2011095 RepID=UPI0011867CCE|nr:SDR family NAD(P)-dependent oxidoreductase [Streptomyces sp. SAJ15]TVL89420.1 oxidoreductase [Streptomyces sp. SAJ15]